MANKVQEIREKVEKLKSQLLKGACSSQVAMETRCKEEAYNDVLGILDTMQEEPISEDWGKCTNKILLEGTNFNKSWYAHPELALEAGAKWQKEQMMKGAVEAVISQVPCSNEIIFYNPASVDRFNLPQEMNRKGLEKGDKVKLVIIKED